MRLALSLTALAAVIPANHADACGPMPAPHMLAISHHGHHTFVVLDEAAPKDANWRQLFPDSYDYTRIADAPDLEAPVELTLLGRSGTRVVTATHRVFLDDAWTVPMQRHVAFEVEGLDNQDWFEVAVVGRRANLSWRTMDQVPDKDNDGIAWLAAHGRRGVNLAYLTTITGTTTQIVTWFDSTGVQFAVRRGDADLGEHEGLVIGELDMPGRHLLVRKDCTTVAI